MDHRETAIAGEMDWEEVTELVNGSYRLIAPKRLAALMK
jgi:hypothetical protein